MEYTTSILLIFGGVVFLTAALAARRSEVANMRRRTPVQIKIAEPYPQNNKRSTAALYPEYVVVSGPQAGLRKVTAAGPFPVFHNANDLVEGYLDPATNEVRSVKECRAIGWLIAGLAGIGTVLLAIGIQLV